MTVRFGIAAQQLGDDLPAAVAALATRAIAAVDAAGPARRVAIGPAEAGIAMQLDEYLRTRVFELTVHGVDIADAAGLEWTPPSTHLVDALHLAGSTHPPDPGARRPRR